MFLAHSRRFLILFFVLTWATSTQAQPPKSAKTPVKAKSLTLIAREDITDLPLEQLMDVTVVSAAKKEQRVGQTASAIYVITAEDIRRQGVTSVIEALRMAPGVQVTRSDSQTYSVTARGFSQGVLANKMLVLIDGRSVYSPLYAGVFWDVQDINIENVARIEVIRGSRATLWGANAVNGVINILTKHSKDMQGLRVTGGGGLQERAFGSLSYGGALKDGGNWRASTNFFNRDNFSQNPTGRSALDDWYMVRGDFRMDWDKIDTDSLMLQGGFYAGDGGSRTNIPSPIAPFSNPSPNDADMMGAHVLGRWTRDFDDDSKLAVLSYFEHNFRRTEVIDERNNIFNLEGQYDFNWGPRQAISVGAGYRFVHNDIGDSFLLSADPSKDRFNLIQAFVQDEIALVKQKLKLILGTRLERNSYTDFEWHHSGRLLYTPTDKHSLWASSSKAIRSPTRLEDNVRLNASVEDLGGGATLWTSAIGSPDFGAERVWDSEVGYRFKPIGNLSFDLAAFYNRYNNLRTFEVGAPFAETSFGTDHTVLPFTYANMMDGHTYGFELASEWQVFKNWRLAGSYSLLKIHMSLDPGSTDPVSEAGTEGASPTHQFNIRSYLNLPHNLEFDTALYYVGPRASNNSPRYTRVDARLGWKASKKLTLSVVGQNIFDSRHPELVSTSGTKEVDRAVYGKFTLQF